MVWRQECRPVLRRLRICDGKLVETDAPNAPVLLYLSPDEQERRQLLGEFHIDEHTLTSALDPDELSRLEFEPDHAAVIFKRPRNYSARDEFLFKVTSTGVFLFRDRIVIVQSDDVSLFEGKIFNRICSLQDLLLRLIYRSIFHFLEHLKAINSVSGELEQHINTAMENRYLLNLFTLEKSLVYYLNAINSNAKVIDRLQRNAVKMELTADNLEFLDDISIENTQCYRQAEIYSNILASMMDARASIVSNNLNVLMKTLNIITIGIMVPTLVVSAFSMNVTMPLDSNHPVTFWIIMSLAFLSVAAVIGVWRYKKW
jgi:magnesium transporter